MIVDKKNEKSEGKGEFEGENTEHERELPQYEPAGMMGSAPQVGYGSSSAPATDLPYGWFEPTYLVAKGRYLEDGFPLVPPPSDRQPHPFITHGVHEADWTRFLTEIGAVGGRQEPAVPNIKPHLPAVLTSLNILTQYIPKTLKETPRGPASNVVDSWNQAYFRSRKMEVILANGVFRLSGPPGTEVPTVDERDGKAYYGKFKRQPDGVTHTNWLGMERESRADRRRERREKRAEARGHAVHEPDQGDRTFRLFLVSLE